MQLPKPDCHYGYTESQVCEIMGERIHEFDAFQAGATVALCTGKAVSRGTHSHYPTNCGPHGYITYVVDVIAFLEGFGPLD